jgi:hypothetical protein
MSYVAFVVACAAGVALFLVGLGLLVCGFISDLDDRLNAPTYSREHAVATPGFFALFILSWIGAGALILLGVLKDCFSGGVSCY